MQDVKAFSRKRRALAWSPCLLLPVLTSCVLFPHSVVVWPVIDGHVSSAGMPVSGARILLYRGIDDSEKGCEQAWEAAETDADGRFLIQRRTQFRIVYQPLVAPLEMADFGLCVESQGQRVFGTSFWVMKGYDKDRRFRMTCALDDRRRMRGSDGRFSLDACDYRRIEGGMQ